jgi:homoserine dehydrogenase
MDASTDPSVTRHAPAVRTVTLGVLGCGNVGAALCRLVQREGAAIAERTGIRLRVGRVAVRSLSKERDVDLPAEVWTTDGASIVADPSIDVVVELLGGIEPARQYITDALKSGKPVVTANKELLANVGDELFVTAEAAGVDLLFEASVAGGVPLIRPLRESLAGERITRVMGIVNGTTNFILSQMTTHGASYHDALAEAQSLGFAERDPTADVEGFDAGAKAAILASIAFGARVVAGDVYHEGIAGIDEADIAFAAQLGYVIKLLAICERFDDDSLAVRVHPAMVPQDHPLAAVRDSFNAVFVEGEAVGDLMFYGRGAGGFPTASAVLGDVIDAAGNVRSGGAASIGQLRRCRIRSIDELHSPFYINLRVADHPGVLAAVAGVFGEHGVSIRSMEQEGLGDDARLVFITHSALEADLRATLKELGAMEAVLRVRSVLRVIGS